MNKIIGVVVAIVIIVISMLVAANSLNNLNKLNEEIEEAKPYFEETMQIIFDMCNDVINLKDYDLLLTCKEQINSRLESCGFYGNPSVCSDPIIKQVDSEIQLLSKNLPQEEIFDASSINLITYTNTKYHFSLNYPENWVVDETVDSSKFGTKIVAFKDRQSYPKVSFYVEEKENTGNSFDVFFSKYKGEIGGGYAVNIKSEKKIFIGNLEAYELDYVTFIGKQECLSKEYVIDGGGSFVPILDWDACTKEHYEKYLPLIQRIAQTFRFI